MKYQTEVYDNKTMTNPLRKPPSDSTLDSLPPEPQRRILDWLTSHTYVAVLDKIAAPAPEGLGLKIHCPSLKRSWNRHINAQLFSQRAHATAHLKTLGLPVNNVASPYPALSREAIERYCFHMAMDPQQSPHLLLKLQHVLIRLRELGIQSQKLAARPGSSNLPAPQSVPVDAAATSRLNSIDHFFMKLLKSATELPKVKTNPPINDQNTPINANSDTLKHAMPHLTGI